MADIATSKPGELGSKPGERGSKSGELEGKSEDLIPQEISQILSALGVKSQPGVTVDAIVALLSMYTCLYRLKLTSSPRRDFQ